MIRKDERIDQIFFVPDQVSNTNNIYLKMYLNLKLNI